jgi:hypothetical protein
MPRPSGATFSDFFLAISKILRILKEIKLIVLKNVQRNQKSATVERPGLYRPDCGGGVELPDRNGLVPHEEERYGLDEVCRTAKTGRVRKPQAVKDHKDHQARECAVFLALAAARPRVPGAGERKRSARIAVGAEPAQVS